MIQHPPIHVKNHHFPTAHKKGVAKQINEYLKQGIIQPSSSPWNAPIWIVPKKADKSGQEKWGIVTDYRRLNAITIEDTYPLPNIDDIFESLKNEKYFTTIDLASGFHEISIHPDDREKTAFSTQQIQFEFLFMSFGTVNAPRIF